MFDPFSAWSRMVAAGLEFQSTWLRGVETMQASHRVIDARSDMIRTATVVPLAGDYVELSRMVPEKVEAFSRSANAITGDILAMQSAWMTQMQRVSRMMLAGRVPTLAEMNILSTQTMNYSVGATAAGAKLGGGALAPIHRTVTGNARRLQRRSPR